MFHKSSNQNHKDNRKEAKAIKKKKTMILENVMGTSCMLTSFKSKKNFECVWIIPLKKSSGNARYTSQKINTVSQQLSRKKQIRNDMQAKLTRHNSTISVCCNAEFTSRKFGPKILMHSVVQG